MERLSVLALAAAAILVTGGADAAPVKQRLCKDHLHTGEAQGYQADYGGSVVAILKEKAEQDWVADVTQHDGARWANLRTATERQFGPCTKTLIKGKGWKIRCTVTARPCRYKMLDHPSTIPRPPISGGSPWFQPVPPRDLPPRLRVVPRREIRPRRDPIR